MMYNVKISQDELL